MQFKNMVKYLVTFSDDCNRFCYVYFLNAKNEALEKFKIYKTEVEMQLENMVNVLELIGRRIYGSHVLLITGYLS